MSDNGLKDDNSRTHWASVRESGTLFGLRFLRFIHDVFGRWLVSLMLLPTVAYFLIFRPLARHSSQDFLKTHYEQYPVYWKSQPNIWNTVLHMQTFAETVVDKLLSWSVNLDIDQFVIENPQHVEALRKDPRGQLIIGSHMGNLEYCRGFMHRYKNKVVNILVHDKHSKNYNALMQELNPESRLNVFQVEEFDIPTMLLIKSKIDAGEWVFIAGDRSPLSGVERTALVEFFGRKAYFPIGPYMLAKGLGCPVKLMFSYCDYRANKKDQKIHFQVVPFAEKVIIDRNKRDEQLQAYAQQFARELERQCAKVPYQWFNFYDFWAERV
jgi:predicted LPLAT superfamily acyltransferase